MPVCRKRVTFARIKRLASVKFVPLENAVCSDCIDESSFLSRIAFASFHGLSIAQPLEPDARVNAAVHGTTEGAAR
jgi:hypothetical protein